jgi:hypothetical protein
MNQTAEALEELLLARLTAAPDRADAFKRHLRPIVAELLAELLPTELRKERAALVESIDYELARHLLDHTYDTMLLAAPTAAAKGANDG